MNVIGISGSSRKGGNTSLLLQTVFEELNREGVETRLWELAPLTIEPCRGCFACTGKECCPAIRDDFHEIWTQLLAADGILLGSPVYSADVSAKMKAFLERAGVAAVRRGGGLTAVDTMNHFMLNKEMILVGSTYWNMVYGKEPGDVFKDQEGMKNMRNLGQNFAWVLKNLQKN